MRVFFAPESQEEYDQQDNIWDPLPTQAVSAIGGLPSSSVEGAVAASSTVAVLLAGNVANPTVVSGWVAVGPTVVSGWVAVALLFYLPGWLSPHCCIWLGGCRPTVLSSWVAVAPLLYLAGWLLAPLLYLAGRLSAPLLLYLAVLYRVKGIAHSSLNTGYLVLPNVKMYQTIYLALRHVRKYQTLHGISRAQTEMSC